MVHLPPVIQLASAGKIGANDHNRLSIFGARHSVGERNRERFIAKNQFNLGQRVGGQGLAVFANDDHVGSVISKLAAQLGLHVDVEVHHRGSYGGGNDHGQQRGGSAPAAEDSGAQQHACKHRSMRRWSASSGNLLWSEKRVCHAVGRHSCHPGHPSPRSANTGSNFTARRMAAALPPKVTNTASARMIGKSTGSMEICELKIDRPIWCASSVPAENPAMPPTSASNSASAKKRAETERLPAPRA